MTFSGGVAEYLYKRETRASAISAHDLAEELRHALAHRRDLPPVWDPGQGIRATVIGAAQFSVQISGNTILIADPRQAAAAEPAGDGRAASLGRRGRADAVAAAVRSALARVRPRGRREPGRAVVPLARRSLACAPARGRAGICAALPRTLAGGDAAGAADRRRRRQ